MISVAIPQTQNLRHIGDSAEVAIALIPRSAGSEGDRITGTYSTEMLR